MHEHHTIWPYLLGAGGQYVFSALVSTMPPYAGNNYGIKWLYAFLHAIAANLDKVHIPGSAGDLAAAPKNGTPKP
jgi:hypothetical protein